MINTEQIYVNIYSEMNDEEKKKYISEDPNFLLGENWIESFLKEYGIRKYNDFCNFLNNKLGKHAFRLRSKYNILYFIAKHSKIARKLHIELQEFSSAIEVSEQDRKDSLLDQNYEIFKNIKCNDFSCNFNKAYFITLLNNEVGMGTCRRLCDNSDTQCKSKNIEVENKYLEINSAKEFYDLMKSIKNECETKETKPLLHIEGHGNISKWGLEINASQEIIPFKILINIFREINLACSNNLYVVLPICYGTSSIFQDPNIANKCAPFYCMVTPYKNVTNKEIDKLTTFYNELYLNFDCIKASEKLELPFKFIYSEQIFLESFIIYYLSYYDRKLMDYYIIRLLVKSQIPKGSIDDISAMVKRIKNNLDINKQFDRINQFFNNWKEKYLLENNQKYPNRYNYSFSDIYYYLTST